MASNAQTSIAGPRAGHRPAGGRVRARTSTAAHDMTWHWRAIKLDGLKTRAKMVASTVNRIKQRPDLAALIEVVEIKNSGSFPRKTRAKLGSIIIHASNLKVLCLSLMPNEPRLLHALTVRESGQVKQPITAVETLVLVGQQVEGKGNSISAECFRVIMNLPAVKNAWFHNLDVYSLQNLKYGLGTLHFDQAAFVENLKHLSLEFDARNAANMQPQNTLPSFIYCFRQLRTLRVHFSTSGDPYIWRHRLGNAIRNVGLQLEKLDLLLPSREPSSDANGSTTSDFQESIDDDTVGSLIELQKLRKLRINLDELADPSSVDCVSDYLPAGLKSLWFYRVRVEHHEYSTTSALLNVLDSKAARYPYLMRLDCGVGSWTNETIAWRSTSWRAISEACEEANVHLVLHLAPWTLLPPIDLGVKLVFDETEGEVHNFLAEVRREDWIIAYEEGEGLPSSGIVGQEPLAIGKIFQRRSRYRLGLNQPC